jgi:Xaa-Pro dipeptidase
VVEEAGMGERFVHGLGHGVGLEIHEAPALGSGSAGALVRDMVVTVEPGVYLPGQGGVRIEDTLVVPAAGGPPERLTLTGRDLLVL